MKCTDCGAGRLRVYDTRTESEAEKVARHRRCDVCGKTVTTCERVVVTRRVRVVRIG